MAQQEDTISHFSHPGHELVKRNYIGPSFLCDMCWEHLSGPGYGCSAGCDFGIHESCAGHPQTLSSQAHHAHPLVLVQTRRDVVAHICDVCVGDCAAGCFLYRCPPCGFDMHPRCARLPQIVRSSRHSEHDLTLVDADGCCAAAACAAAKLPRQPPCCNRYLLEFRGELFCVDVATRVPLHCKQVLLELVSVHRMQVGDEGRPRWVETGE